MKKVAILLCVCAIFVHHVSWCQISTNESPISFSYKNLSDNIQTKIMPPIEMEEIQVEDSIDNLNVKDKKETWIFSESVRFYPQ